MKSLLVKTLAPTLVLVALAAAFWWSPPNERSPEDTEPPPRSPGHRQMVDLLVRLAHETDPGNSPYLNRARAALLGQAVRNELSTEDELETRLQLSLEFLRGGQTAMAIDELDRVSSIVRHARPDDAPLTWLVHQARAIAFLRLGEQQNCVLHHSIDSCLLPIQGNGIHRLQHGSRTAIRELGECLRLNPGDNGARWLLNVAYMTLGEYPDGVPSRWRIPPAAFDSGAPMKRFRDVAAAAGVAVVGLSGGAAVDDFTGDGRLDVVSSSWGFGDPLRFFANQGGGVFEELTTSSGLEGITGGLNICHADFDNDGHRDILVLRGAWLDKPPHFPNSLLRNRGNGTFEDVTRQAGLLSFHPTQTATWGDYNGDGWLDLFVGNETAGEEPHPCELFHNNGDGTFTECAAEQGLAVTGFVKGVVWGDYDSDGRPDLFVSRLGEPNLLFRNDGPREPRSNRVSEGAHGAPGRLHPATPLRPWQFVEVAREAGVTEPRDSFPAWFWDYDNDGRLDLFVASYGWRSSTGDVASDYLGLPHAAATPRLFRNRGDGGFSDVTTAVGIDKALIVMGSNFGDLDGDGFLDFYVGTGEPDLGALIPNRMFKNVDGKRFVDVTTAGGFGHLQKGHGIAFGDFDEDGDQDVYAVFGGAYEGDVFQNALFENPGTEARWVTLRLEGTRSSRDAIGARVQLDLRTTRGTREIHRTVGTGGSFGSSSLQLEIGLADALSIDRLVVTWPGGGEAQRFVEVPLDSIVTVREGDDQLQVAAPRPFRLGGAAR